MLDPRTHDPIDPPEPIECPAGMQPCGPTRCCRIPPPGPPTIAVTEYFNDKPEVCSAGDDGEVSCSEGHMYGPFLQIDGQNFGGGQVVVDLFIYTHTQGRVREKSVAHMAASDVTWSVRPALEVYIYCGIDTGDWGNIGRPAFARAQDVESGKYSNKVSVRVSDNLDCGTHL